MNRTISGAKYRGFTLTELLVTLTIAAILLGVAAPNFSEATANSRQTAVYNSIVSAMRLARSESIKQSGNVAVCARQAGSDNACGLDWNEGWLVFSDDGATPGIVDNTETILRIENKPNEQVTITNKALLQNNAGSPIARPFIRFGPRGTSNWRGAGSFQFCDNRGTEQARAINVTLSGDVRKARRDDTKQLLDAFQAQVVCP